MGRTTDEHESLLSHIDSLLVLSYLYESERARSPDLGKLEKLAQEVVSSARRESEYSGMYFSQSSIELVVCQVMNELQAACGRKNAPAVASADLAWDGLPEPVLDFDLRRIHSEHRQNLADLFRALFDRLVAVFPLALQPYVTQQMVSTLLREIRRESPWIFSEPVHIDVMSSLAHQEFLAALRRQEAPASREGRMVEIVSRYSSMALNSYIRTLNSKFVGSMVEELLPRARRLHLVIDRTYPWGALWRRPLQARSLLEQYASLNRSGALKDTKYRPLKDPGSSHAGISAEDFIVWALNVVPTAIEAGSRDVMRKYYKSDDSEVVIDGTPLQKHAVMAIRYDQPLPDVERALSNFRTYLLRQRLTYCSNANEPLTSAEEEMVRRVNKSKILAAKAKRSVLHDMSSILRHISALLYLEMRSEGGTGRTQKALLIDVHSTIKAGGFEYSSESIRKAVSRIPDDIKLLRAAFVGQQN